MSLWKHISSDLGQQRHLLHKVGLHPCNVGGGTSHLRQCVNIALALNFSFSRQLRRLGCRDCGCVAAGGARRSSNACGGRRSRRSDSEAACWFQVRGKELISGIYHSPACRCPLRWLAHLPALFCPPCPPLTAPQTLQVLKFDAGPPFKFSSSSALKEEPPRRREGGGGSGHCCFVVVPSGGCCCCDPMPGRR